MFGKIGSFIGLMRSSAASVEHQMIDDGEYTVSRTPSEARKIRKAKKKAKSLRRPAGRIGDSRGNRREQGVRKRQ